MQALQANAASGFTWLHPQETGGGRTGSSWQTHLLLQSPSSNRVRAHHAALSGFDHPLFTSCRLLRGGVSTVADGGHDRPARLSPSNRCRYATQCISMVASLTNAGECLPQLTASTTVTECRSVHCGTPFCAAGVTDAGIPVLIAVLWTTTMHGLSVAIATIISVNRTRWLPVFFTFPSFPSMPVR